VNGGQGYFTQIDTVATAIHINLIDKQGVVFLGTLGTGNVWYGTWQDMGGNPCRSSTRGENANGFKRLAWMYDPADLARVAAGTVSPWAINPAYTSYVQGGVMGIPPDVGLRTDCEGHLTATYCDPDTRRLYIVAPTADPTDPADPLPLIHVFQIL